MKYTGISIPGGMKWVTREKAKVDRIACPWVIKRFVDRDAEFIFVPKEKIAETAAKEKAIPFDAPGVELTHYEEGGKEYVSFDAIIKKYGLKDQALLELARIVRGADADTPDAPPESAGLEAAALGFRDIASNDHENMRLQFPFYDAMYRYCQLRLSKKAELEHAK
ncbi:MAG: chromate resistance protein [Methanomassiliicoccales archaeon]|nr:chromate resistance protein [Methanomassiliicoccales archaeon]